MQKLVTSEEMKAIEQETIERIGIPAIVLMERAACSVVQETERFLTPADRVLVVCGTGNNGADGLAVARMLTLHGYSVSLKIVGNRDKATELWRIQKKITENLLIPEGNDTVSHEYTVIVDALFGIGLSREVSGLYRDAILDINERKKAGAKVVSVDIPSGLNSAAGQEMGVCVRADVTVTFQYCKQGMLLYPGAEYAGCIVVKDVGIVGADCAFHSFSPEEQDIARFLPKRRPDSNKGSYGKVLVIAGSEGMCGAAYFSACAAYRAGAGLVRVYTPSCNRSVLQALLPEAIVDVSGSVALEPLIRWASIICIGPGLSVEEGGYRPLLSALDSGKTVILDADALNLLAKRPELMEKLNERMILTPHPGEMSRLTGKSVEDIKADLVGTAAAFSRQYHAVCVLKDARTVTALADGACYINTSGNAGMAKGGSGDVLAGMIAGLAASGAEPSVAAWLGVYLHGLAGDRAREERGMTSMTAVSLLDAVRL